MALAYAQTHPEKVAEIILRGVFTATMKELSWFFVSGLNNIYPDKWDRFLAPIPRGYSGSVLKAYSVLLHSTDPAIRSEASKSWCQFEHEIANLVAEPYDLTSESAAEAIIEAQLECHYFINGCFLEENQLLQNARFLAQIPGIIVHGRYDMICPLVYAWNLHSAWPGSRLEIVEGAGHAGNESGIMEAVVRATDHFATT